MLNAAAKPVFVLSLIWVVLGVQWTGGSDSLSTVTLVAAGDIACSASTNSGAPLHCDQAATAALVRSISPTVVVPLGDNQYEKGALADFQQVYASTWGSFKGKTRPAVGNHEYLTSGASGYFSYFGSAAGNPSQGYYAFNVGQWRVYVTNDECSQLGSCASELTWLKTDMQAHHQTCMLMTAHEPRFSSGKLGDARQDGTLWNAFVANGGDVALYGHNHDYERFAPLGVTPVANTQPTPSSTGAREFVVGTGGKNLIGFPTPPLDGEQLRNATTFGVLKLTLNPSTYSWKFVNDPASGSFTDSGSANCH